MLLIYRSRRSEVEPDLAAAINGLEKYVSVEEVQVPAVVGGLAGAAISIFTSQAATALANFIQIGTGLWLVIQTAQKYGRTFFVDKEAATPLAAAKLREEIESDPHRDFPIDYASGKVWGPMEAEPLVGFHEEWFVHNGASIPRAYFVAIAVPWHRGRVRTFWYVISDRGQLCSSWWTQTLRERVPDFLRPGAA
jgi:hypothetical protein